MTSHPCASLPSSLLASTLASACKYTHPHTMSSCRALTTYWPVTLGVEWLASCSQQCQLTNMQFCVAVFALTGSLVLQLDINEVNKIAHELKNRLERLQKLNETSLSRKVCLYLLLSTCTCYTCITPHDLAFLLLVSGRQSVDTQPDVHDCILCTSA